MSILRRILDRAPVPYVGRAAVHGWFGRTDTGTRTQLAAMGSVGTLFTIVSRTSTAVAAARWRLYRTADDPADRVEVTRHVALDTWRRPNPFMSTTEFVETVQQHIDLTGEGWWAVSRLRGMRVPGELWPMRPDRVLVDPSPTDFLTGYVYLGPDGTRVPMGLDEVGRIRMPNPEDPYRGMGPVQALLVDLDSVRYASEWNRNFFRNSAEPGGLIEVDRRLSDDEFDEMSMRWSEQHRGVANAHRVAIIEQGRWKDRAFSMRDMQFAELRAVSRDVILEGFGISRATLGMTDGVNFAAARAARTQFAELLTVPRLERWKAALNGDFLSRFGAAGNGVEFDYDSPVGEDGDAANAERDSKTAAVVALVGAGFDPTAVLEAHGMPELPHTRPQVPQRLVPDDVPSPSDLAAVRSLPDMHDRLRHAMTAAAEDPDDPDLSEVDAAWRAALARLLDRWGDVDAAQRAELIAAIVAAVDAGDLTALAALDVDPSDAARVLREALDALAARAAAWVVDEAAEQGATVEPVVPEGIDGLAAVVAGLLAAALAVAAGREALRVHRPGMTGAAVGALVGAFLRGRSDVDRRTTLGAALTGAQNDARIATMRSGPIASIYASETLDGSTCGPCRRIHGRFMGTTDDGTAMAEVDRLWGRGTLGGYVDCEGGVRCRGTVTGVWRPRTTGDS